MDVGHLIRFPSQQYPFLVETTPCLDLDCPCSVMKLTLTEVTPSGARPDDGLTFTLRVCLKTWTEHDPPPRSLEVESLVREFMARLPAARIRELGEAFQNAREVQRRLESLSLTGTADELVSYAELIHEQGGIRNDSSAESFFFVFEGREFLIEDHYCANPQCDCRQVHVEFWERVHEFYPEHGVKIEQILMVAVTLDGELKETRYSHLPAATQEHLLKAWRVRGGDQLREFRRRYDVMKEIGARSFPTQPKSSTRSKKPRQPETTVRVDPRPSSWPTDGSEIQPRRVRRNDPCPCGSGLKFKRCCARSVVD